VGRPAALARSRIVLVAAAAVALTALSGMARVMISESAEPATVAVASPEPAALPALVPVPVLARQPEPEGAVVQTVAVLPAPEAARPRAARMIEFEDADKLTLPELLPAPATVAAVPVVAPVAVAAKDAGPARAAASPNASRSEESLRQELAGAPEVGLRNSGPLAFQALLASAEERREATGVADWTDPSPLIRTQRDLRELPLHGGRTTQLNEREAGTLDEHSRKLRAYLTATAPVGPDGRRPGANVLAAKLRSERKGTRPTWLRPEAIPALLQLLMHEDPPVRRMLVELLEDIPCAASTRALAQRAAFDLDAEARQMAVEALRDRDPADYRPVLLKALRYPWAPAAQHAAEALVALNDRGAIPELITLLQQPDPALPHPLPGGRLVVQEVVRARHLTNCILCHPPSLTGTDSKVLGVDPVLTMAFPSATIKNKIVSSPAGGLQAAGSGRGGLASKQSPDASLSAVVQQSVDRVKSTTGCHDYSNLGSFSNPQGTVAIVPASEASLIANDSKLKNAAASLIAPTSGANASISVSNGSSKANEQQVAQGLAGKVVQGVTANPSAYGSKTFQVNGNKYYAFYLKSAFANNGQAQARTAAAQSQPGQPRVIRTANSTLTLLPMLIRGDITYLRQDFSLTLQVPDPPPGAPFARTRYDYFVRTRDATASEKRAMKILPASESYPQRESVLSALRGLTGQDAGPTAVAWREMFPQAEVDLKAARLCREVVQADGFQRVALLGSLRDGKGLAYTLALAGVIPALRGEMQETARQYLTDRLSRMTAETLRDKLGDDDPEVRRAAVLACTRKGKRELVPDLIALLEGDEPLTTRLAEAGLKELTGRSFEAPGAWQAWWQGEGREAGSDTQ
jgi:hypothetical protein